MIDDDTAGGVNRRPLEELERDIWHGGRQVAVVSEAVEHQPDVDVGVIAVVRSTADRRYTAAG